MDDFRTKVSLMPSGHTFGLNDKILTIGSCFSDALGQRMQSFKLPVLSNPYGVVYNPLSIIKLLRYSIFNEVPAPHTYLQHGDVHLNYDFHSEFSALQRHELERHIASTIGATHFFLKEARYLIITLGTAWAYDRQDTGDTVANCHKMPGHTFLKKLLTQKQIVKLFEDAYASLKSFNPDLRIILTVSPVRHIKDTLELNNVSKAVLRITCHTLQEIYPDVDYFPSYEMVLDDLRDYRFYKSDMIHPTEQAEDYCWNNFIERYAHVEVKQFMEQWKSIRRALQHKPFHPSSAAHQKFLKETLTRLEGLQTTLDVEQEIRFIQSQLLSS